MLKSHQGRYISVRARKDRQEIKAQARKRFEENRSAAVLLSVIYVLVVTSFTILESIASGSAPRFVTHIILCTGMIITWVMTTHLNGEYTRLYSGEGAKPANLFTGFRENFLRKLGGYAWMILLILLWAIPGAILFGIGAATGVNIWADPFAFARASGPQIVISTLLVYGGLGLILALSGLKALTYSFTPYILGTNPNVSAQDALRLSIRMTAGYRGDIFVMGLSFAAWFGLSMTPLMISALIAEVSRTAGSALFSIIAGTIGSAVIYTLYVGPYMMLAQAGNFAELRDRALHANDITPDELWPGENRSIQQTTPPEDQPNTPASE